MLLNLLLSLCCVIPADDTLDIAKVSVQRNIAMEALSPVQTMSGFRLERLGSLGLHEAINLFSGVSVKDYGGIGGLKTVSVRNMGASHTSVIYDGIAVSDAQNGQIDISRFNLDGISSVSMSIGMTDDIFCSARHMTSAGILKMETVEPDFRYGPTEISARFSNSSFETYSPYISLTQKLGEGYAVRASASCIYSKGNYPFTLNNGNIRTTEIRQNSDVKSFCTELDFFADWDKAGKLKAKFNLYDSERGLPGSVVLYTSNPDERLWDKSLMSNIMYNCTLGESWKLHTDIGFFHDSNRHVDMNPAYNEPQDSRYCQDEYSIAARCMYTLSSQLKFSIAEDIFLNTLYSNIPECPFPVRFSSVGALSGVYKGKKLTASLSLVRTFISESLQTIQAPDNIFRISPILGISWSICDGLHFRTSFKDGFRVPTFNDLYYSRVGNPDLRPEKARQFNSGLTYTLTGQWGTIDISADSYYNFIHDKITATPTMFIWKMRNIGKVRMYGLDLLVSSNLNICRWMKLHLDCNYSLQYALNFTDPDSKSYRHQIPYTPRHCSGMGITFEMPWLNLSCRLNSTGKRYAKEHNLATYEMAPYNDCSIAANKEFKFEKTHPYGIYIGAEIINLSGTNYEIIQFYPMPGLSYRLTVKFKY